MKGPKIRGAHRLFGDPKETLLAVGAPQIWAKNGLAGVRTGDLFSPDGWGKFPALRQLGCDDVATHVTRAKRKPGKTDVGPERARWG